MAGFSENSCISKLHQKVFAIHGDEELARAIHQEHSMQEETPTLFPFKNSVAGSTQDAVSNAT